VALNLDVEEVVQELGVARLENGLAAGGEDLIWGGDWNQALHGSDSVTTAAGRPALAALITALNLKAPTTLLAHTKDAGTCSIDHIAVPDCWNVSAGRRLLAKGNGDKRLSDHDAYIVDVEQ